MTIFNKKLFASAASICAAVVLTLASLSVYAQVAKNMAGKSSWGAADEIGTLNMMSDTSRFDIFKQIASGKIYDLGVDLFVGMPICCLHFGDPSFQIWMSHSPARGNSDERVSHSGEAVSMSTHSGTHIDTLGHFGLNGKIWNQVSADDAFSVRGWSKSTVDKYPPIVSRAVLVDVARSKNVKHLPASYAVTVADIQKALEKQRTTLRPGDVVLIRTGLMTLWPDKSKYRMADQAGLSLEAAQWLIDKQKAMMLGADNFGVESFPSKDPKNFAPLHTYLLAEQGVSIIEVLWLEELAKDQVYEFLFIASAPKMRGATGSPIRPIAIPIRRSR
jgi:kynurenine formamidase